VANPSETVEAVIASAGAAATGVSSMLMAWSEAWSVTALASSAPRESDRRVEEPIGATKAESRVSLVAQPDSSETTARRAISCSVCRTGSPPCELQNGCTGGHSPQRVMRAQHERSEGL